MESVGKLGTMSDVQDCYYEYCEASSSKAKIVHPFFLYQCMHAQRKNDTKTTKKTKTSVNAYQRMEESEWQRKGLLRKTMQNAGFSSDVSSQELLLVFDLPLLLLSFLTALSTRCFSEFWADVGAS